MIPPPPTNQGMHSDAELIKYAWCLYDLSKLLLDKFSKVVDNYAFFRSDSYKWLSLHLLDWIKIMKKSTIKVETYDKPKYPEEYYLLYSNEQMRKEAYEVCLMH